MPELVPYPFDRLVTRMFAELEQRRSIFDLPERKFVLAPANRDLSVRFHGKVASTPLGPAAGPQSQLAQNLVLSFLGGGRIFELKTVQIQDRLTIPRPCIDMRTVGYNVEWSQELTLDQSLEEYVKAAMLVEMLVASGKLDVAPDFARVIFDMSVGYDLAGIRSERVGAFMRGMMDASQVVERLRRQIPDAHAHLRELEFPKKLSSTLTLSTYHGCPPDEIERITSYLLEEVGLDCVVKLNPTLLGKVETRRILNDVLGYPDQVPDKAFDDDAHYDQAVGSLQDALLLGRRVLPTRLRRDALHRGAAYAELALLALLVVGIFEIRNLGSFGHVRGTILRPSVQRYPEGAVSRDVGTEGRRAPAPPIARGLSC